MFRLALALNSDVWPRGLMGLGVRMDSVLPALTRRKFRRLTKKLFACQAVSLRRDISEYRDKVSMYFYLFTSRLVKEKDLS